MNKLLNNLLGMYKQAKLNKKAEEVVEDVEDIEKWFSVKLDNDQAKEFTKLLTENNIKNKSKKEGEEIRVSFFLLPSSIGVAQGLLAATLSKFPDKQASTIKKAEEDLIEVGWGLYTNDEYEIKENALYGGGEIKEVNKSFWDKINKDIEKVEMWFLKDGYKQFFAKVRDEGHGKDSELGGTAWMTKQQLEGFIDRAERTDGNRYTIREEIGGINVPFDYDETLFFTLDIIVDEETLDDLNIESKRVSKNKKLSSKNTKLNKKAKEYGISDYLNHFNDVQQYVLTENKGDLGKAVEDLLGFASSEYDKARFPREYVYKLVKEYIDDTIKFQEMINHPIKEEYIVKAKELLNKYKVENKIANSIKTLHKKSETFDVAEEFAKKIIEDNKYAFSGHTDMAKLENNAYSMFLMDNASIKEILDEAKKIVSELDNDKDKKLEDADLYFGMKDRALLAEKVLEEKTKQEKQSSKSNRLQKKADYTKEEIEMINKEKEKQIECGEMIWKAKNALYGNKVEECKEVVKQMPENCKLNFVVNVKREGEDKYYKKEINEIFKVIPQSLINEADEILKENPNTLYVSEWYRKSSKAKAVRKQAENKEIVVTYEGTNGKEYIVKAPNGLYFNEYVDTDTQHSRGAGPFETLEKAKEMFKKHRPSAKEVVATKKQATIKHENGVYNVYSESGKCLGKGYKTKEEAEKRLKQVEYFKHKKASVIKKAKNLSEIDGDAEFMSDLEIGNGMPYNSDDYDYFEVYKIHAKNPKDTYNNKYVVVSDDGSILAVREKEEDIIEITYDDMLQELRWRRLSNRKTQPNKRTSLKQVVISKMAKIKK